MQQLTKPIRRAANRAVRDLRAAVVRVLPEPVHRRVAPYVRYMDMLLLDHVFLRVVYPNRHRISKAAWRSAQPLPYQIGLYKRQGIKTIVNLRGGGPQWTYHFEKQACDRHGMKLVTIRLRSRASPSPAELHGLRELFQTVEHPILMHCKSGADRAGLAAVIYRHVIDGAPISEAKKELSLWYGHVRHADTGVIDYFFERYLEENEASPVPFFEWVDTRYDPEEINRTFKANGLANRFVNDILNRE
ncbi:MAG: sulfur transferase domain-containing protein [Hyphomicrobium sp.]|nr:sulfur transferase domain-containing protein [Hyphomicrobium sp.]